MSLICYSAVLHCHLFYVAFSVCASSNLYQGRNREMQPPHINGTNRPGMWIMKMKKQRGKEKKPCRTYEYIGC